MGFQLAEIFVDLTLRDAKFGASLTGIKTSITNMGPQFDKLQTMANRFLLAITGLAVFAAKEMIDAEDSTLGFAAALDILGKNFDDVKANEEAFFDDIQKAYVLQNDEVRRLATSAIKLGATYDSLNKIVQLGIGLGERYFGGNAQAGVEAMTQAQQGNFRALGKMIPAIKDAQNNQQALDMVVRKATEGLKFAEARSQSMGGSLRRLWNETNNLAQSIGQMFVPYITRATDFIHRAVIATDSLTDSQKRLGVQTVAIAAAFAAVITIGPRILNLFKDVFNIVSNLANVIFQLGKIVITVATGPMATLIAILVVTATALAFFMGTSDQVGQRVGQGFAEMLDMANVFLGGWQNVMVLWNSTTDSVATTMLTVLEYLKAAWKVWSIGVGFIVEETWNTIKMYFEMGGLMVKTNWNALIDTLTIAWVTMWASIVRVGEGAWNRIQKLFGGMSEKDFDAAEKDAQGRAGDLIKSAIPGLTDNIKKGQDEAKRIVQDYVIKQLDLVQQTATKVKDAWGEKDAPIEKYKQEERDRLAELSQRISQLPMVSEKIKKMVEDLKKSVGLPDFEKKLKDVADAFNKIKTEPDKFPGMEGGLNYKPSGQASLHFTSLQDAFKQNLAMSLLGDDFRRKQQEDAKAQREKMLREQQNTTRAVNELQQSVIDYANQLAGGMAP